MPYLTSLLMPVSSVVTGLPPTLSDVGSQLNTSNTILYTTSAATLSAGSATSTFLPVVCATVVRIPEKIDSTNQKIDSTNSKLEDLKTTTSAINSYTSIAAAETNAIRTNLNGTITAEIQQIRSNTTYGTNSNIPLFVNQGTLTYLADSVSIDTGAKRASSPGLVNSFSVSLSTKLVYNIFGVSTASIDQYLQIYDITGATPTGTPAAVFLIPANSNFSFDFNRGFPFTNTKILIANSLTPVDYNPGNSDVFITVLYN